MELGGKSPVIVLPDADLDVAIPGAASAIFFNHGQVCCAGLRLHIAKLYFDHVVDGVAAQTKAMKLGPGLSPTAQIGPLVSSTKRDRLTGYLDAGRAAGARAAAGGHALSTCRYYPTDGIREREQPNVGGAGDDIRNGGLRPTFRRRSRHCPHGERLYLRSRG